MNNTKYNLLYSTSLFIIPTVYGYYNKKYTLSTMSLNYQHNSSSFIS